MSRYGRLGLVAKCGSVDSRYFGNPEQFDKDIQDKQQEHETFKQAIRDLVFVDPNKIDLRYRDVIDVMLQIKKEHGL